jgi:hypothetical protein
MRNTPQAPYVILVQFHWSALYYLAHHWQSAALLLYCNYAPPFHLNLSGCHWDRRTTVEAGQRHVSSNASLHIPRKPSYSTIRDLNTFNSSWPLFYGSPGGPCSPPVRARFLSPLGDLEIFSLWTIQLLHVISAKYFSILKDILLIWWVCSSFGFHG